MGKWVMDAAHTQVGFSVRHMMFATVRGHFGKAEAVLEGDAQDLSTATITATIDAASINTNEAQRDGHLRSADFFHVEEYPSITFNSKRIAKTGADQYAVTGDLTIRGVTKEVTLDATVEGTGKDPWGNTKMAVNAAGTIDRSEYGLTWNAALEAGGVLVGDKVKLNIETQFLLQA